MNPVTKPANGKREVFLIGVSVIALVIPGRADNPVEEARIVSLATNHAQQGRTEIVINTRS